MLLTIKDRLIHYIRSKGETISSFEQRCRLPRGYIKHLGNFMRADNLTSISYYFADLNVIWLLTGKGDMCRSRDRLPYEYVKFDTLYNSGRHTSDEDAELIQQLIDINLNLSFSVNSIHRDLINMQQQILFLRNRDIADVGNEL